MTDYCKCENPIYSADYMLFLDLSCPYCGLKTKPKKDAKSPIVSIGIGIEKKMKKN